MNTTGVQSFLYYVEDMYLAGRLLRPTSKSLNQNLSLLPLIIYLIIPSYTIWIISITPASINNVYLVSKAGRSGGSVGNFETF